MRNKHAASDGRGASERTFMFRSPPRISTATAPQVFLSGLPRLVQRAVAYHARAVRLVLRSGPHL